MRLLLDLGNSRLKWRCDAGDRAPPSAALPRAGHSADELVAALALPAQPDAIRLASVAGPGATANLVAALARRFTATVQVARTPAAAPGLRNAYADPEQLGVDRWLALRAACSADARPACVVAAGTACTLDLVAPGGDHRGGLIVPGLALMAGALRGGTGDLDRRAAADPPQAAVADPGDAPLVARATGAAIALGARWALAALVLHHAARFRDEFPETRLLLTGGDASALLPLLPPGVEYRPDLVLEGLACEPFAARPPG